MSSVLGLDIGSKCMAFAILDNGKYVKSWTVDLTVEGNIYVMSHDAILEAMRIWESSCEPTADDFCSFESIPMRFGWSRILIELVGGIKTVFAQRDYGYVEISPTTIKKRILGSGKSPKDQKEKKQLMVDAINKKFGLSLTDHNESDSVAIAFVAYSMEKED